MGISLLFIEKLHLGRHL